MADTRIILRQDTSQNWAGASATNVAKGELAFQIDAVEVPGVGTIYNATGRLGTADSLPFESCPRVATGNVLVPDGGVAGDGFAGSEAIFTSPVVYEDAASKPDGTTVRWDATDEKWVADAKVVTLDAYPSADGTVVFDSSAGKFVVGAAVSATVIDGGSY